jgi:pyruvate/2-oxoglutarate/acetoin dehydrogenase E1 component
MRPLDVAPIVESVRKTGRLMVVQECGQSQGLGDRVISLLVRKAHGSLKCAPLLIAAPDVPLPFAPELEHCCRPSIEKIVAGIERILGVG